MELAERAGPVTRQEEFAAAVLDHGRSMFRCARSILDCDADAEDAVGEAVLKAWQAYGRLRDKGAVRPWLLRITANCAYDQRRRSGRVTYTGDLGALDRAAESPEPAHDLWQAVCALAPDHRAVVTLFYYEDMSLREISRTLGLPEGTVKSRLARARNRLKELLQEEEST